uniref:Uncharacterized protein n=1 Tax=Romanomermis culicivorax TaxID=13658 RepID=A0A915I6L4_ROMCU
MPPKGPSKYGSSWAPPTPMHLSTPAPNVPCCLQASSSPLLTSNHFSSLYAAKLKLLMAPSSMPMARLLLPWSPPLVGPLEVTELATPIFLIAQASVSILPNCQQWVTSTVFPPTIITIPDVIVQPLTTNSVALEFPIETVIVNNTNGKCLLLFVNNTQNSIKLRPNQLIAVAKHALEQAKIATDCQVAAAAADCDLTDH